MQHEAAWVQVVETRRRLLCDMFNLQLWQYLDTHSDSDVGCESLHGGTLVEEVVGAALPEQDPLEADHGAAAAARPARVLRVDACDDYPEGD